MVEKIVELSFGMCQCESNSELCLSCKYLIYDQQKLKCYHCSAKEKYFETSNFCGCCDKWFCNDCTKDIHYVYGEHDYRIESSKNCWYCDPVLVTYDENRWLKYIAPYIIDINNPKSRYTDAQKKAYRKYQKTQNGYQKTKEAMDKYNKSEKGKETRRRYMKQYMRNKRKNSRRIRIVYNKKSD